MSLVMRLSGSPICRNGVPLRVIFFDLFETLVTLFDPEWSPPPRTIAGRLGVTEEHYRASWPQLDLAWQAGKLPTYQEALAALCAAAGTHADHVAIDCLTAEFAQTIAQVYAAVEPEIIEMVAGLKVAGYKLGVITNAGDIDTALWSDCALASYFDDFVASHRVRLLKRDRRIFDLACERVNVAPADAIFIGDGGGNEFQGASEAGLTVYWSSWFLDRWPEGRRPNGFPGDEWRQYQHAELPPFIRLTRPAELLQHIG